MLLKYWQLIAGALVAFVLSYGLHALDVDRIEKKHQQDLFKQHYDLVTEFMDKSAKVEAINVGQENRLKVLDAKYRAAVDRVRQYKECVPVTATTGQPPTSRQGLPWANGVEAEYLIDKSTNADTNTEKLDTCNQTLDLIYGVKNVH